ncbi:oligopeptide ABC transporter permease [Brevibacillus borstelensis]|uniref:oligopeptide ABC transporter permease n=1 Tax=Brevibacillus borstelensis TaxID=45462 RepID=UPI001D0BAD80|nr:oligopeptide ABC transporter permease [Brevibacillus borstelensis]MCC0563198.1 ABC transporter permease [Brevibacillus borstelensis]MCM3557620.1 ABC transporter permease [Brevibacillus borstelensis]MCM3589857.1 ABC transporter permease [Brevibacillus borstelensis]MED1850188.1 ABC transporter permease [Brevibacillus borstelensis]WNF07605.1 ABC transporter permease [Brevibacillus borstelensis]
MSAELGKNESTLVSQVHSHSSVFPPAEVTDDLFVHEPLDSRLQVQVSGQTVSVWKDAWRRLLKNRGTVIAMCIIVLITLLALIGPQLSGRPYDEQNLTFSNLPPKVAGLEWLGFDGKDAKGIDQYEARGITEHFWFGTDEFGRDLWTRVWKGTQISLTIALLAALLDLVIGVAYGGISAFYGGKIDNVMQRIIEVLVGIPNLIVIILFILILDPGIFSIVLAMIVTGWVGMARVVRGQMMQIKAQEFVLASRALGASNSRLIVKHLLPNAVGPILVTLMFTIPTAIFFEAFLSFIGLGLQPPLASLGVLIQDGYVSMRYFTYKLVFPGIVISALMISFNLLADGLRDALDPRMKK